ncbi:MAG: tripartite tricarboxylate transporter permease [Alphaproteobacteria bacterium]|nr:tripartite tricarboxylate transporter permease [Alphaproteobacteria bacterium]
MHELLGGIELGLAVALTPINLAFCLIGVLVGTLIGVLPGIGPVATMAMLLPITFSLSPSAALIMLSGIYYGAQYGGSTTAILVNVPGESSSVVTCIDGFQMARQGRAGTALAVAALASFLAGTVATLLIAVLAGPLTRLALLFGAPEYFALMTFGLICAVLLSSAPPLRSVAMILLGILCGLCGADITTNAMRFTFGIPELTDGLGFVPIGMGVFGLAEIIRNLETGQDRSIVAGRITGLMPGARDLRAAAPAALRGTGVGALLGVLPGGGAVLASFAAYALERRIARDPDRFGKGAIEGVAGPEAANNAGAQSSFIPLLTLGIPENSVMALMAGAMMIQGIQPSPQIIKQQPELFWGIIASMWIGNALLLVINLPLIRVWVSLLRVPYRILFPLVLLTCSIGVYSVGNSTVDIVLMAGFGALGYLFLKLGCEPAPMLLGFILGPMMEENLRRALLMSYGSYWTFVERPISAGILALAAILLVALCLPAIRATVSTALKDA